MITNRWKAGALLIAAVLAGAAAGSLLTVRLLGPGPLGGWERRGHSVEGYVKLLDKSFRLNPGPEDSVRAILTRHRSEMDAIWHEVEPRYETLRTAIRSEIRLQLGPEQATKYDDLTARLDRERRMDKDHRAD